MLGGDVAGAVARAVVDDEHRGRHAADLGRHQVEHVADVLGLVVGGDEDRDLVAEALRQLRLAELLPGEPLERRRELARVARRLRERPQDQQEEDEDREDGEAEDAAAVALFEGEGGEQLVGDFGAGDERQAEAGGEQDQHVDVAQRAAAQRSRRRRAPTAAISPALRSAVSSAGKMPALGRTMSRWRIGPPSGPRQGRAGKRKDQCHQHLVAARGRQRGGADGGDERDRGRHRDQLPPAAAPGEHAEAGQAEQRRSAIWTTRPAVELHRFADPGAPHPPDLARGHRRVADRVFAEVVGEVLLADLAQRLVARQVRVAVGDAVEERRRVDLFERFASRGRGRGAGSA